METLIRAGIAASAILLLSLLYLLYQRWQQNRTPNLLSELGTFQPGTSVIVYFTTPACQPCKTIQRPALQQVSKLLGSQVEVFEIDASQKPEVASRWGVLSVPTTFVFDPQKKVRHINHGVARAEKLLLQLNANYHHVRLGSDVLHQK